MWWFRSIVPVPRSVAVRPRSAAGCPRVRAGLSTVKLRLVHQVSTVSYRTGVRFRPRFARGGPYGSRRRDPRPTVKASVARRRTRMPCQVLSKAAHARIRPIPADRCRVLADRADRRAGRPRRHTWNRMTDARRERPASGAMSPGGNGRRRGVRGLVAADADIPDLARALDIAPRVARRRRAGVASALLARAVPTRSPVRHQRSGTSWSSPSTRRNGASPRSAQMAP